MTTRLDLRQAIKVSTLVFLMALSAACASDEGADKGTEALGAMAGAQRARFGNLNNKGLNVTEVDLDQDGKTDQWKFASDARTVRIERDLNFDGAADVFLYVNGVGEVLEEEMDLDVDGKIDVVNYYRSGVLNRKEYSVDFKGTISIIKYYDAQGKLTRVERDTDINGRIDVWEYYQGDKKVRTGRDISGDGTPDVFEEAEEN